MTLYGVLVPEETDKEINNNNQLRNIKKKLKKKEFSLLKKHSPELETEICKIRILILEYEDKVKGPIKKDTKKKRNKNKGKEFLDENEIKNYNIQRQKEIDENEIKEREQQRQIEETKRKMEEIERIREGVEEKEMRQEEEKRRHKEEKRRQKEEEEEKERERSQHARDTILSQLNNKGTPRDIKNLFYNFSMKQWKRLQRKYHPDKRVGDCVGDCVETKILNNIKDYRNFNEMLPDETWRK